MPAAQHNPTIKLTPDTYHCYRCGKNKPATREHFYFRSDGSIISGCKECHARMAADRRDRRAREVKADEGAQLPLGIVEGANPAPALIQYRCEGCGRSSMSANPEGPRGWKRVRLTGGEGEEPATLCPRCTASVQRAFQVVQAVTTRRRAGRGRQH